MAAEEIHKHPTTLPSYPEMIMTAIVALNERNGSNKTSISKYIESNYGNLSKAHRNLVSQHLFIMKDRGELVFWKNNYTKPDPNAPPRRGRGRPPKPKDPLAQPSSNSPAAIGLSRPRGSRPKDPNAALKPNIAGKSGRPRGRPRKTAQPATSGMTDPPSMIVRTSRPRGRPPKVKPTVVVPELNFQN